MIKELVSQKKKKKNVRERTISLNINWVVLLSRYGLFALVNIIQKSTKIQNRNRERRSRGTLVRGTYKGHATLFFSLPILLSFSTQNTQKLVDRKQR